MSDPKLLSLADEIEALVHAEVDRRLEAILGPLQAKIAEIGPILGGHAARLTKNEDRIEQVAKEPRVHINPEFIVPTPAVHVAPNIILPPRKPTNKTFTKQPDGSFKIEEIE